MCPTVVAFVVALHSSGTFSLTFVATLFLALLSEVI